MYKIQVLVSTMNKRDIKFIEKMKVTTDVIVINQSDKVDYSYVESDNQKIEMYTFNERGLSKSRNNALMRATADIICIADDDMVYVDNYEQIILKEFELHPKADAILFYVESINGRVENNPIKKFSKLKKRNYMNYSSVDIAVKRDKLIYNNIWFNTIFGSGSKYMCGEDTIIIKDMIKKGLNIYVSPQKIAKVNMNESTWFNGYNETFFNNKGALVAYIYKKMWLPAIVLLSLKNSKSKLGSYTKFPQLFSWYYAGVKEFNQSR